MSLLSKLLNFFKCETQGTQQPALEEVKVVQLEVAEKAPAKKVSKPRQPKAATPAAPKAAKPAATKTKAKASK